ncbi:MAG: dTDP-4-dehydrorhamnose 3,5-epimerase [SAR116 cluster bacterium]|nr:dTDP-4-dehydrorhamnose 3,5-epimerase [SAR116 cluster bacterium]RPH08173.1 MAG: dTDP-4-dehydrorhamnose 3,5-epimerase [Alphaproteobacteria bacterium TMED54]
MTKNEFKSEIENLIISPLKQIIDERGKIMHMLKKDSEIFSSFGEIYFSTLNPGIIKGWHSHKKSVSNLSVIHGFVKLVIFDGRTKSKSKDKLQILNLSEVNYYLITIPPGVWYSFKNIAQEKTIIANCSTLQYDEKECLKMPINDPAIPFFW